MSAVLLVIYAFAQPGLFVGSNQFNNLGLLSFNPDGLPCHLVGGLLPPIVLLIVASSLYPSDLLLHVLLL